MLEFSSGRHLQPGTLRVFSGYHNQMLLNKSYDIMKALKRELLLYDGS
jgi:hypothetical protein